MLTLCARFKYIKLRNPMRETNESIAIITDSRHRSIKKYNNIIGDDTTIEIRDQFHVLYPFGIYVVRAERLIDT